MCWLELVCAYGGWCQEQEAHLIFGKAETT
jgi:hypothetical protein